MEFLHKKNLFSLIIIASLIVITGCSNQTGNKTMEPKEIKTASGLRYIIQKEAEDKNAQQPKTGQTVTVHYTGLLEDNGQPGKKFDSSVDRGEPFSFPIGTGMVIKGWDEGVMTMTVGEKRRLIIPAHLGYGPRGIPGVIPGNAILIFDVELLEIK
ncbi:MAG TPA: FKBP-type peptidyl-prolyl cis-trans isomerase [Candidatus Babeliales bacterium]|nr:FKBP-type peptidyl-prolyl cis-trans isomerase [Candidatus Babeliales bacterium]